MTLMLFPTLMALMLLPTLMFSVRLYTVWTMKSLLYQRLSKCLATPIMLVHTMVPKPLSSLNATRILPSTLLSPEP